MGFPFIFRGALAVRASAFNEELKIAPVKALRDLAKEHVPEEVLVACQVDSLNFGPDYIIPKPVDPRLLTRLAPAVARAAVESGVARLPMPENYNPSL